MSKCGCDRGHSIKKTGGRVVRGLVNAVKVASVGVFAVLLKSCVMGIAMIERLLLLFY